LVRAVIDLHVHILPGLDDGPADMAEAVAMGRLAVEEGTTTVVATPHMLTGLFNVTRDAVLDGVQRLRERFRAEAVPLSVEPGADVHLAPDLPDLLRAGRLVTVMGTTPIISHPERNFEVQMNPEAMRPVAEAGAVLQLTAASVVGDFGRRVARCAHQLLRARLTHVIASDAHSPTRRPPGLARARAVVERILSPKEAEAIFVRRPERILAGQYLDLPEPTQPRSARREAGSRGHGEPPRTRAGCR
jgi:protein-tyrosine phosphatase